MEQMLTGEREEKRPFLDQMTAGKEMREEKEERYELPKWKKSLGFLSYFFSFFFCGRKKIKKLHVFLIKKMKILRHAQIHMLADWLVADEHGFCSRGGLECRTMMRGLRHFDLACSDEDPLH